MITPAMVYPSIEISLVDQKVLTNETVRIQVPINALITDHANEETVRREIHTSLKRFIDTEWVLSNPTRGTDSSGVERLTLTATSRVPETENYDLEERLRRVSRAGLKLGPASVDNSFPLDEEEKGRSELRLALLKRAKEELDRINEQLRTSDIDAYAFGEITFQENYDAHTTNRMSSSSYAAANMVLDEAASSAGGSAPAIGHSKKIIMTATVVYWQNGFAADMP